MTYPMNYDFRTVKLKKRERAAARLKGWKLAAAALIGWMIADLCRMVAK